MLLLGTQHLARGATILAVRVWPAPDYTRVTIESDGHLKAKQFFVTTPPRLAVDIEGIDLNPALKELVAKHKSGLDILAGSEQFDRPNAQDAGALEELRRVLTRAYDYVVIDAGNVINACTAAALYAADTIFLVTNPDVPSIRNAQRLVDRVRQLGAGSERVKVLLNRSSDQNLVAPKQIETALGYGIHHTFSSDYRTVSTALNSGVPLALTNHSEIAAQFGSFTRHLIGVVDEVKAEPETRKRVFLGIF